MKVFESGLALYTATYLHTSRPFSSGDSIDIYADTGLFGGVYVWPTPEQKMSSVPGLKSYHVTAYGRWKADAKIQKKLVTGTLYAVYSSIFEDRPYSIHRELPILYTQIYITKPITQTENRPNSNVAIDFYFSDGSNLKTEKTQFSYGGQNFPSQEAAIDYAASQEQGNPDLVVDTSYISLGKKLSDFFDMQFSPAFYNGNFGNVEPRHNSVIIGVNENDFGTYKEVEVVKSSMVNEGSITANLIYDFGSFTPIE